MRFEVRGFSKSQDLVVVEVLARTESEAMDTAMAQGISVISAKPRNDRGWRIRSAKLDLNSFSRELAALLQAGLTLIESIETLSEKEERPDSRQTLDQIRQGLYGGQTLSVALEKFPAIFPPLYVASIRSSEQTGDLAEALNRYVSYQSQLNLVKNKLIAASVYPLLLLVFGVLVTAFLLAFVVPKFSHIYGDHAHDLPVLSALLMHWGQLIEANGGKVLAIGSIAASVIAYYLSKAQTRTAIVARIWQIPFLSKRARVYHLARFYRTLGMLLRGGTPIVSALQMTQGLLQYAGMQHRLQQAVKAIRQGEQLSHAFERHGLTTPVALRMLRVGEKSGSMARMTEQIAAFYDEEISRWVEMFTRLFEPLLMAVIGLVIGGIVVLMYMPIFELAGSVQ